MRRQGQLPCQSPGDHEFVARNFDLIASDRKGEKMYVITLHPNGIAYKRTAVQMRRNITFKVALSVAGAVITFVVGILLKIIFS